MPGSALSPGLRGPPHEPISPHPNFVTKRGWAAIEARRASARLIEPSAPDRVRFGVRVTLRLASGADQAFRLVGEDEADAGAPASSAGRRRWHRRFLGRQPG